MNYEKYDRFFIRLEGENRDFAMRTAESVRGHIKIETGNRKGAMRIGVQNLRYQGKGDYLYKLIFFGTKENRTIYAIIGTLSVNPMGSGETYFRFDPSAMNANGQELSEFSHAIVAAVSESDEREPLHPVLKGVLDFPGREANEKSANVSAASENPASGERPPDSGNELGGEPLCYNAYYNKYIAMRCLKMDREKNIYDRVVPFREDVTGAEWTKVTENPVLPLVSPGGQQMVRKYRHYIFGQSGNYYYFGVPGRFLREEQPENGASGFTLWQPIVGAEDYHATEETTPMEMRRLAYGYWIVAIEKESGNIVEA